MVINGNICGQRNKTSPIDERKTTMATNMAITMENTHNHPVNTNKSIQPIFDKNGNIINMHENPVIPAYNADDHVLSFDTETNELKCNNKIIRWIDDFSGLLECLPKDLASWCLEVENRRGVTIEFTALASLSALSAAAGKIAIVKNASGYGDCYLNIWSIIGAPQGIGKSSIMSQLMSPIYAAEKELRARNSEADYRFVLGNCTSEGLKNSISQMPDSCINVSSPEARDTLDVVFGRYIQGGSDIAAWLALKTGDYFSDSRICRATAPVQNSRLSLFLMTQTAMLEDYLKNRELLELGFFSRTMTLLQKCERRSIVERECDDTDLWESSALCRVIDRLCRKRLAYIDDLLDDRCTDKTSEMQYIIADLEARKIFLKFQQEANDFEFDHVIPINERLDGICSRWREDAIQVAGLFALIERITTINADLATRACNYVRIMKMHFIKSCLGALVEHVDDDFADMVAHFEKSGETYIAKRDLMRALHLSAIRVEMVQKLFRDRISVENVRCDPYTRKKTAMVRLIQQK